MSKRKGRAKEAKVNTPIAELDEKETLMHYNAVLMEQQNTKFDIIIERLDGLTDKVGALEDTVGALEDRVDRLESRLSTVEHAIRGLKDDMIDMERRICSKLNRVIERTDNHESRISALEANQ